MSAIEMMDPKMDAGMLCNKAKKVLQFEPAVKVSDKNRSASQTCISDMYTIRAIKFASWLAKMQFCCVIIHLVSLMKTSIFLSVLMTIMYSVTSFLFFKAGFVKIKDFSAEELIGIMDELIACLVGV